ncbi:uncharacterized protein LOC106647699 [Copidosoma floridanum]|uniref:uncharacterized protein LOC106647699 n=1 Tax=Copidosoma floridanum TaxID=29053 RepID=UPI000C6F531A|nr:uncharacterized protein LOC106647699 [Copidosoma floridanum]
MSLKVLPLMPPSGVVVNDDEHCYYYHYRNYMGGMKMLERASAALVARKSIVWARESLERLPIRLTLENVGLLALLLALVMPRFLTYALVYPIFRLVFGTLYPAYASYKAVRTKNVKEYVKWMMYWIVFALFTCAETFTDVFFSFCTQQGGGGLVQQLRKSYSLSDLTGEKEDAGRIIEHSPDEVDLDELCRRERTGRRGYSPRRTQSGTNHVEMYFSEVDVELTRQSRARESAVGSLTNVKSSEDISSGYSSGEALQSQNNKNTSSSQAPLVRTASVGARNRTKVTRSSTKKLPEIGGTEVDEREPAAGTRELFLRNPASFLIFQQTLEFLTFLSQNTDHFTALQSQQRQSCMVSSDSEEDDSSTLKADDSSCLAIEEKKELVNVIKPSILMLQDAVGGENQLSKDDDKMCLEDKQQTMDDSCVKMRDFLEIKSSTDISRSSSDCSERAGKYHKRPAPKAPETLACKEDEEEQEEDSVEEKPVKATLVIKTGGTVKSFTSIASCDDAEVKRRKKSSARTAARESFSKLLTIPKNIFHSAFHKEREADWINSTSESVNCDSVKDNRSDEVLLKNVEDEVAEDHRSDLTDEGINISSFATLPRNKKTTKKKVT